MSELTGYPSIDRPWMKHYPPGTRDKELPKESIFSYLYTQNNTHKDDTAITFGDAVYTYGELLAGIDDVANHLSSIGVKSGDIVTLMMLNTPVSTMLLYALNKIGAVSDWIYFTNDSEAIQRQLRENDSKIFIVLDAGNVDLSMIKQQTGLDRIIYLPMTLEHKREYSEPSITPWNEFISSDITLVAQAFSFPPDNPAVIIHTGGTTGSPKSVMLSNENINACACQLSISKMGWERGKKIVHTIPPFVAYGVVVGIHNTLTNGMNWIMTSDPDPEQTDALVKKYHPYCILGGPPHVDSIINSKSLSDSDIEPIKMVVIGGESLGKGRERKANLFFHEHGVDLSIQTGYGMSETAAAVCVNMNNGRTKFGTIGIPLSHTIISIFDPETSNELQFGEEGEICISGPNLMLGYYNNSSATKEIIRHHHGRDWLHTGDIGTVDEDGFVSICGRIKRMFMVRSISDNSVYKMYPSTIETAITSLPYVENCCVIVVPDDAVYNRAVAFVQLNDRNHTPSQEGIEEQITSFCNNQLPAYSQPSEIVIIDAIPLTPSSKMDYRKLEKLYQSKYGVQEQMAQDGK